MVGKPNIPDHSNCSDIRGAAMVHDGLDALDQEREASMADEGGATGAECEFQNVTSQRIGSSGVISEFKGLGVAVACLAGAAVAGVAGLALARTRKFL